MYKVCSEIYNYIKTKHIPQNTTEPKSFVYDLSILLLVIFTQKTTNIIHQFRYAYTELDSYTNQRENILV